MQELLSTESHESLDLLHDEGWSLGHTTADGQWSITGFKGKHRIQSTGSSLEAALERVCEQLKRLSLLPAK